MSVMYDRMADTSLWTHVQSNPPSTHLPVLALLVAEVDVSFSTSQVPHHDKNLLVAGLVERWVHHSKSRHMVASMAQIQTHLRDRELQVAQLVEADATSPLLVGKKPLVSHHVPVNHQPRLAGHKLCVTLRLATSLIRRLSDRHPARSLRRLRPKMDLSLACTHLAWRTFHNLRQSRRMSMRHHQDHDLPITDRL